MPKDIKNFRNGLVYGITLIVPGVSATIFAIMLGFYDELLHTMNHFREDYRKNIRYFAVFLLGIITGAVLFSSVIVFLLYNFSLPSMALFLGLLLGIVPFIYSKAAAGEKIIAKKETALAVLAFIMLFLLAQMNAAEVSSTYVVGSISTALIIYIFIAGIINGATLVIPGLSGAFILLIMGLYPLIISAVAAIGNFIIDASSVSLFYDIIIILLPFGIGALIGCLGMARIMEKMLRDYNKSVHAVILGFLIGSVVVLPMDPVVFQSGTELPMVIGGIIMLCIGFAASYLLKKKM